MTLLDDPTRTYRDPVEEVARAQFEADWPRWRGARGEELWWQLRDDYVKTAKASLKRLSKIGFLSPLYYDAIEAQKKGKRK